MIGAGRLKTAALVVFFAVLVATFAPLDVAAQGIGTSFTTGEFQVAHWNGRRHKHLSREQVRRRQEMRRKKRALRQKALRQQRRLLRQQQRQQQALRQQRLQRQQQQLRQTKKPVPAADPNWYENDASKDPIQIIVSLPEQRLTVYRGERALVTSRVSSGKIGHTTPAGVFSILGKKRHHRSNIYSGAPMPFMQRLTWSGIALHQSNSVPDYPASHGCIRMPGGFASQLFGFTQKGVHVVVANEEVEPKEITHATLFQPAAPAPDEADNADGEGIVEGAADTESETDAEPDAKKPAAEVRKRSTSPVRILVTRRTGREQLREIQELLAKLAFDPGEADGYMGPATAKAIKRFQTTYSLPANGLVSEEFIRKLYKKTGRGTAPTGHLYVRQDFNPVLDVPVVIKGGDKPLGSHLYTAMHFDEGDGKARWLTVTLTKGSGTNAHDRYRQEEPEEDLPEVAPSDAEEALSRIEIPDDVRQRISEMLTPGSSLAITNDGISRETTPKGTDFVVLMQ